MVKEQILRGKVNGKVLFSIGTRYFFAIFPMELTSGIIDPIPLMEGTTTIVYYRSTKPCYVKEGDQVEIIGKIIQKMLKQKPESFFVETSKMYNETLQFSFDY